MLNPFSKTPFLFLLIPLIGGIVLQYYIDIHNWSIAFILIGLTAMLFSYLLPESRQFSLRWLFGVSAFAVLLGIGVYSTSYRQEESSFSFANDEKMYWAKVIEEPQEKNKTTAYKVELLDQEQGGKKVVCYIHRGDSISKRYTPGDEFFFRARIQPFHNIGDFDYASYMHNHGFAGSAYVTSGKWGDMGKRETDLPVLALQYRGYIMDFYKSLGFDDEQYAILSALTLGYQNAISDDLKQSFRTTGTVHVLSVSGLHVGIIYAMMSLMLSFIRKKSKYYWLKPTLIILMLWMYAFITGLPPSVIRATGMLTVFCIAEICGRKSFSIHNLYIAAFFMLLVSPLSLFDIGFQLSFLSTLSILLLYPHLQKQVKTKNKFLNYIWQLFALSLVAQLATFPLCLYYFGTFPTYFFVTNLFIVPLVVLITYSMAAIVVAKLASYLIPSAAEYLFYLPVEALKLLVKLMTSSIRFFESLPFALVSEAKISFLDLILLVSIIVFLSSYLVIKRSKLLVVALFSVFAFICCNIYEIL